MIKSFFKKIVVILLTLEARIILAKYAPYIVGITGSVGKTSTKDAVASVATLFGSVRASEKSYNSELGIPLTVLGCETAWGSASGWLQVFFHGIGLIIFSKPYPKWLVLEMGVDHPGDMKRSVSWVRLDSAIITHVGVTPVHVEFFSSPQEVFEEKKKIIDGLCQKGTLVLSYDDEQVLGLKDASTHKTLTYGRNDNADVRGDFYSVVYDDTGAPTGCAFKIIHGGNIVPFELRGVVGQHLMYPCLAACAFGLSQGLNLVGVTDALRTVVLPPGRMRLLKGLHNATLIDDTYNASPVAVESALKTLQDIKGKRKIAVLGDMMELGKFSESAHADVGTWCSGIDVLVTVGSRMRGAVQSAKDTGVMRVESFDASQEAGLFVKSILKEGDVVLLKGSQSVRVEHVTKELLAHPEQADSLLVRQGTEWSKR
ncbi:MAG: UDP-N-acetylmuramoyl-tripeptide--D-alanyl-D-alanine ligase [Candidatus Campbellbacteria bacterium]|nr:UDP-N-acetylmuramoyl-tripeptide--D-alanyl-D-alanine ligase [Candidatus Campbellbacteria bacterium]